MLDSQTGIIHLVLGIGIGLIALGLIVVAVMLRGGTGQPIVLTDLTNVPSTANLSKTDASSSGTCQAECQAQIDAKIEKLRQELLRSLKPHPAGTPDTATQI